MFSHRKKDNFIEAVEDFMNKRSLERSACSCKQWSFPFSTNGKSTVGNLSFRGNESELILEDFDQLVDTCMLEQEKNNAWKWLLKECNEACDSVKKK